MVLQHATTSAGTHKQLTKSSNTDVDACLSGGIVDVDRYYWINDITIPEISTTRSRSKGILERRRVIYEEILPQSTKDCTFEMPRH